MPLESYAEHAGGKYQNDGNSTGNSLRNGKMNKQKISNTSKNGNGGINVLLKNEGNFIQYDVP
jgi:hypothetical protein